MSKSLSIVGSSRDHGERDELDFYPTPAYATEALLARESFTGTILEPACGDGAISEVLKAHGANGDVCSFDIVNRGYGLQADFFDTVQHFDNIITNPPYNVALEFILKSKEIANHKIAMFLKTVFLESTRRYEMFTDTKFPLKTMYQFSKRVTLYKGGVKLKNSGMISYAWFVWDRFHVGKPTIQWIGE